jgi:cytochrome c-type biogenesis protein CcmH
MGGKTLSGKPRRTDGLAVCENLQMNSFLFVTCFAVCFLLLFIVFGMKWANSNKTQPTATQASPRLAVFKDRKRELDADLAAGRITEVESQQALDELGAQLQREASDLLDSPQAASSSAQKFSWGWALGLLLPAVGIALGAYGYLGAPELTESSFRESFVKDSQPASASAQSPNKLPDLEALKQLTIDKPKDASVWGSLGRGYRLANNYAESVTAYAKAKELGLSSPDFLVDYAEAIAASKKGDFSGEPVSLLAQALKMSPDLPKGIALMGAAQYRLGNFSEAKIYLKRTLDALPPGSEQAAAVQGAIDQISAAQSSKPNQSDQTSMPSQTSPQAMSFTGTLTVSASVKDQLKSLPLETAALFIAVRSPERPMPIAAIKIAFADIKDTLVATGKLNFSLDEKNLLPGGTFGNQKSLIVVARLSPQGSATRANGDLTGTSLPLEPKRNNTVNLVIDTVTTGAATP